VYRWTHYQVMAMVPTLHRQSFVTSPERLSNKKLPSLFSSKTHHLAGASRTCSGMYHDCYLGILMQYFIAITVQSSMLSSVLPKKNPTAHG